MVPAPSVNFPAWIVLIASAIQALQDYRPVTHDS